MLAVAILLAAIVAIATHLVSAKVAYFVAAVLVVLFRVLSPKQAYDAVNWPINVMLGSLIPVGEALTVRRHPGSGPSAFSLQAAGLRAP